MTASAAPRVPGPVAAPPPPMMAPPPAAPPASHLIPTPGSSGPVPELPAFAAPPTSVSGGGIPSGGVPDKGGLIPGIPSGGIPVRPSVPVAAAPPMRQPAWRPAAALQAAQPAASFAKIHPETVALGDVQALHALARQGAWRATLQKATAALQPPVDVGGNGARPATNSPAWLCLKTFQVVALAKLRRYVEASDTLNALGDLDDARYNTAPGGACAIPYAMRVLQVELPNLAAAEEDSRSDMARPTAAHAGYRASSSDASYALAERCEAELATTSARGDMHAARMWRRRRDAALHSAVNVHVREGEFLAALARLDWLARRCPADTPDPTLLSLAGRVHLLLGDVEGAEMCFTASAEAVERAATRGAPVSADVSARCDLDAGALAMAKKDYAGARRRFAAAAAAAPASDAVAANNCAAAAVYTCDLRGAIETLEHALVTQPAAVAQLESALRNAASMYDLAAENPAIAKRQLAAFAARFAPDDLDPRCIRT